MRYFGVYSSLSRTKGIIILDDLVPFPALRANAASTTILRAKMNSDGIFDKTLRKEQLENLTT